MSDDDCVWCRLTWEDELLARRILSPRDGELMGAHLVLPAPDLIVSPDGNPYLYRWELVRGPKTANVYFHIQVADDPERPLHDHPWDNFSVILAGGYDETWNATPERENTNDEFVRKFRKGDTVFRKASEAHRLLLPQDVKYSMSLFTTGPKVRDWGFWYPGGWRDYRTVTKTKDNVSTHVKEGVNANVE